MFLYDRLDYILCLFCVVDYLHQFVCQVCGFYLKASFFASRLKWVYNFKIVDENEECDKRHLEIVCELGQVPRTADIVKCFGPDALPFITYRECKS